MRTFFIACAVAAVTAKLHAAEPVSQQPLNQQIDSLIQSHQDYEEATAAPQATDAAFVRRIYLDLTGVIPSAEQVRTFLADKAEAKRQQLIDKLLASPQHARRMQFVFDEMLMERKAGKHVPAGDWRRFLRKSFADNKPYDQLVREMLTADGSDKQTRPAAKFLLARELRADDIARDLGRLFLGRDLQCAQCHDHPVIDDYLQRHYYGLSAFVKRTYLFKDPKTKQSYIGENAAGDVEFTSVFTTETAKTPPRMLDLPALPDPPAVKEPYKVKKTKTTASVPVYSRRLQLAGAMTSDENVSFRLNIANRLWAMMMGRGLVEPLDMMHAENPPTHPKLLNLLADSLQENGYDLRYLLREIALSATYQRSSQGEAAGYATGPLKPQSPEQLAWSMMLATGAVENSPAKAVKEEPAVQKQIDALAKVFATGGQTTQFDAAASQALFLRNSTALQSWLNTKGGLVDRLLKLEDNAAAEALYYAVFSRPPAEDEARLVVEYLKQKKDRRTALQQLCWASLVSAGFRFNH